MQNKANATWYNTEITNKARILLSEKAILKQWQQKVTSPQTLTLVSHPPG